MADSLTPDDPRSTKTAAVPPLDLHCDQALFPAPFPQHNMLLTCCWVMDEFTRENVSLPPPPPHPSLSP